MIILSPIHNRIRAELHKRVALLSRKTENISSIGQVLNKDGTGAIKHPQAAFVRTPWLKLYSPVGVGLTMIGIELEDGKAPFGFKNMYHQPQSNDEVPGNNPYRPVPGLKEITCEYAGDTKALRKATITWNCWSYADMVRLRPFLLQHGKNVVIEWGWSTDGSLTTALPFTDKDILEGKAYSSIQEKIFQNRGNYDAMAGIITNYDWSLRDDGGLDCTTELTAMGVDILGSALRTNANSGVRGVLKNNEKTLAPSLTLSKFIDQLDEHLREDRVSGPGVYQENSGWGPYISWGWMEDNILSKFISKVSNKTFSRKVSDTDKPVLQQGPGFGSEQFGSEEGSTRELFIHTGILTQFRSVEQTFDDSTGNFVELTPVRISNHEHLYTTNKDVFILPGQYPANEIHKNVTIVSELDSFPAFRDETAGNDITEQKGILRNILLHWSLIKEAFEEVTSVEAGMGVIFSKLTEEVGSIWDFQLAADENNTVRVIDNNCAYKRISALHESPSILTEDKVIGDLFTFSIWSQDTIVNAANMTAKLPSSMAVAAMYGTNNKNEIPIQGPAKLGAIIGQLEETHDDPSVETIKFGWEYSNFGSVDPYNVTEPLTVDGGPILKIYNDETITTSKQERHQTIENITEIQRELLDRREDIIVFKRAVENTVPYVPTFLYYNDGNMQPQFKDIMIYLLSDGPASAVIYNSDPIIPIELEITVDGIGGIFPGNVFTIDYLPPEYKNRVVFQVTKVGQTVNDSGWSTVISGQMRLDISAESQAKIMEDLHQHRGDQYKRLKQEEKDEVLKRRGFWATLRIAAGLGGR